MRCLAGDHVDIPPGGERGVGEAAANDLALPHARPAGSSIALDITHKSPSALTVASGSLLPAP